MFCTEGLTNMPGSVLLPELSSWGDEPSDNDIKIFQLISKKLRPDKLNYFHKKYIFIITTLYET